MSPPALPRWARFAFLGVGPLVFLVHLLGMRPELAGVSGDDAIYLGLGQALGHGQGWHVADLATNPAVGKYPPAWPSSIALLVSCGLDLTTRTGITVVCGLAAAFYAAAVHLVVNAWMPKVGAGTAHRVIVALLLAINTVTVQLVPAAMSEALFCFALVLTLTIVARFRERAGWVVGLAAAAALCALTRSVGGVLLLGGAVAALGARRRTLGAALGGGWILQAAMAAWQRAAVGPADEATLPFLHYYVSYDTHTRYYLDLLAAGDISGFFQAFTSVIGQNLWTGPRSLAEFAVPLSFAGGASETTSTGPGAWVLGAALLGLAFLGVGKESRLRAVGVVLVLHLGIFTAWTWPFATRFWAPVFPVLLPCAVIGLSRAGNVGRSLLWPLAAAMLLGNAFDPYHRLVGRLRSADAPVIVSDEDRRLDAWIASASMIISPGDVVVSESAALWLARRFGTSGLELRALLPGRDLIDATLGALDVPANRERLVAELAHSLDSLRQAVPEGHPVWVLVDRRRAGGLLPAVDGLAGEGRIVPALRQDGWEAWRVPAP